MKICILYMLTGLFLSGSLCAQHTEIQYIPARVQFDKVLHEWDGFGFNYVETAQTRNYTEYPQDYGGFSLLDNRKKDEIAELVFDRDGLNVDIVKMFLDPWHQEKPGDDYDHETTTSNMLAFVERGASIAEKQGKQLDVITTLYGPPSWATQQKFIGGRDLDPQAVEPLADYILDWAGYLRSDNLQVRYLSIHNEGEDFYRWNFDDGTQRMKRFDYNMYWPPQQVNAFMNVLSEKIQESGIKGLSVTNGEPSNWTRFYYWGYADALASDKRAMKNLGLLTTHGFINGNYDKLSYGTANALTANLLRTKKPGLHAWITSFSWGNMDTKFVRMIHEQIYTAGVNAVIPWAGIQHPSSWIDGDPNPGTAIRVADSGEYELTRGYYFYKQVTQAGHRGMNVANAWAASPHAFIIAFEGNETGYPDAFVLGAYIGVWGLPLKIDVSGSEYNTFIAYRTSEDGKESYSPIGVFPVENGSIIYDPPWGTCTTFIGLD